MVSRTLRKPRPTLTLVGALGSGHGSRSLEYGRVKTTPDEMIWCVILTYAVKNPHQITGHDTVKVEPERGIEPLTCA